MLRSFCTGALAVVLACGVWEFVARRFILQRPKFVVVAGLGYMRSGGTETQSNEGWARTWFDKNGYRGGEPKVRPKTVIFAIGDSYTEAMQMPDDKTFCGRLQAMLKASGQDVWVANPSIAGGSPARYVYVADWYKTHLHPDRVIVALNLGDFRDDLLNPVEEFHLARTATGYRLVVRTDMPADSRLAKIPSSLIHLAARRLAPTAEQVADGPGSPKVDYAGLAKWSIDSLKAAYGNPIILYIPQIDYFDPNERPHVVEGELAADCARDGLDFINMRADYINRFRTTHEASHGFANTQPGMGHINQIGHEQIAEELAKVIEAGK